MILPGLPNVIKIRFKFIVQSQCARHFHNEVNLIGGQASFVLVYEKFRVAADYREKKYACKGHDMKKYEKDGREENGGRGGAEGGGMDEGARMVKAEPSSQAAMQMIKQ